MKKIIAIITIITMLISMTAIVWADIKPISIMVDGKVIHIPDVEPYINSDGRTMVPVRFVTENLGCQVEWNEGEITVHNENIRIVFRLGEYNAQVTNLNNNITRLAVFDTPAVLKNSRTMVPVRFVSETLEAKVDWNGELRQVIILSSGNYTKELQPEYYIRSYSNKPYETLPYEPEIPFEIEYVDISKAEVDKIPILKELSELPNCTYISMSINDNSGLPSFTFTYSEVNPSNYSNLDPIYFFKLDGDFSGMAFWVLRDNSLTQGLLRNTLEILYRDDKEAQEIMYKQILSQRIPSESVDNTFYTPKDSKSKKYNLFTKSISNAYWLDDGFNVWGTVYRLK